MSDGNSKPAIPAWQRAAQQPSEQSHEDKTKQETTTAPPHHEATEPSIEASEDSDDQISRISTFLEDPAVKDEPTEKKRAFLQSKSIPDHLIYQALKTDESPIEPTEFETFRQQQAAQASQQHPPAQQSQRQIGPPIITYPEFLVDAHKPPPLITPGRIVNAAYIASGIATLVYAASKYLVTPMADSLTESRHDFAAHSQSKVDEMNERLAKLVSRLPERAAKTEEEDDETQSESSDPTELYHRDMGTQTDNSLALPTQPSSRSESPEKNPKDRDDRQANALSILTSHLNEMLDRATSLEEPYKVRQDKANDLRHYLDTLLYASPNIASWGINSDEAGYGSGGGGKDGAAKEDVIDELKKEIRGVKGVLLSAKRFPGVGIGGGRAGA